MALASATDLRKVIGPSGSRITPLVTIALDAEVGQLHLALSLFARLEALNRRIPTPPQCQIDPLQHDVASPKRVLANMSDEQFAALFNELQSRGDRAKLMRIVFLEAHKKKSALLLSRRFIYSNVAWATFCSPILI